MAGIRWLNCSPRIPTLIGMVDVARDRLAGLLAGAEELGAFSAARPVPVRDLHLEVRGVGPITFPVSQAQARELCLLGRPARYGRGEQTLLDRGVRDTWEIPKSRVKIDKRRWNQTLLPVLDRLGRDLGVPSGSTLKAELHSMLVYAPGQFFVQHQDSEKADDMVASLLVGLPSTFTGGALEVQHRGETAAYRGSKKSLSFVAFYSDCRHQVKPVTSGYRIVLTYNLLLRRENPASLAAPDPEMVDSLARCLDEHFGPAAPPDRLVYLLDHEYTPRGLDWSRLKGGDARRAEVLRAAAEGAACEVVLALADVHETWSAYEPEDRRSWYGRSRYGGWGDDEDDEDFGQNGSDDYDLQELIESEITLDSWIDSLGCRLANAGLSVGADEVCASIGSDELDPYQSEYEGYMGNWGNTLDRWYHRGAVVLWPRARDFAVRGEASPSWALESLTARVRKGDVSGAQEAAATLSPFWERAAGGVKARGVFTKALRAARLVEDPALATMLLGPFRLEMLTTSHAKALSALAECYGEPWTGNLVAAWSARRRIHYPEGPLPHEWIASLPALCLTLQEAGAAGTTAARLLLEDAWKWLRTVIAQDLDRPAPSQREESLSKLERPVAAVLEGASLVVAADLRDEAVGLLCRGDDMVALAIGVLRATPTARWRPTGLDAVAAHGAATLEDRLARSSRAGDDWSIELPKGCSCELCDGLRTFLRDRSRRSFEWPLAQDRRAHVHRRIDASELPVTHRTRRQGRPYTLVLTKTDELFDRERQHRRRDEANRAWLNRNRAAPAGRRSAARSPGRGG
jgi:hypothetical protein